MPNEGCVQVWDPCPDTSPSWEVWDFPRARGWMDAGWALALGVSQLPFLASPHLGAVLFFSTTAQVRAGGSRPFPLFPADHASTDSGPHSVLPVTRGWFIPLRIAIWDFHFGCNLKPYKWGLGSQRAHTAPMQASSWKSCANAQSSPVLCPAKR